MTGRVGAMAVDGSLISDTDRARMDAEGRLHSEQQRRAIRVIAAGSLDAQDCAELLAMLGLSREMVTASRTQPSGSDKTAPKRRVAA